MPKYSVLDKDIIKKENMPYLSVAKREYVSQGSLIEVVNAILHKLKSGCQWHQLPVGHLFGEVVLSWNAVYHHFGKWCRLGEWQTMLASLVKKYKDGLDISVTHIDVSHTPAQESGENVEYQGRKKCKTTNSLYFCDRQGLPLAMSEPQKGKHADLYEIGLLVDEIVAQLKKCSLRTDGVSTMPMPDLMSRPSDLLLRVMNSSQRSALMSVMENLPRIIC